MRTARVELDAASSFVSSAPLNRKFTNGLTRRRRNEASGRWAEWIAAAVLIFTGHRVLARRVRTGRGEIDIVAVRGKRLAFVEVKFRQTAASAEAAVTPREARRLAEAAASWVRNHAKYRDYVRGFDRFEVAPSGHLRHAKDALAPLH